ncbi:MAG: glycosyltransferase family 39 protein [Planctomycetota bacterium]
MSSTSPIPNARTLPPLWWPLVACAAAAFGWFVFAAAQRVPYPHQLEWMEGALADHASRIADGLPLYCEPGPEHVPFLYAPLLFWLGGLGMKLGLDGILALRLIAAGATFGCAMLIGHQVRKETSRVVPGLVASGLFLAGYGWLAWWYDLARNDALFVFFVLASAYQLRHGGPRGWFWAGLLATVALLAKQSALMWLPAIGVGALLCDWRRAVRFGLTAVSGMAAAIGVMHLTSDGWSTFWLFEMPRHHGWVGDRKLGFWTEDVLPMLPLLVLGVIGFVRRVRVARGDALMLAAFGCGGLFTSWLSRMHVGGFDNVLMYGFAAACVLGPIAAIGIGPAPRWLGVVGPLLLLAQFGWLGVEAWRRGTSSLLPSAAHRTAHEQLERYVAGRDAPIWIPGRGHIAYRYGKGTGAHGQAIFDLLQLLPKLDNGMLDISALFEPQKLEHLSPRARDAVLGFYDRTRDVLHRSYFSTLVIDNFGSPPVDAWGGLFGVFLGGQNRTPDYVKRTEPVVDDLSGLRPLLGYELSNPYVLERR